MMKRFITTLFALLSILPTIGFAESDIVSQMTQDAYSAQVEIADALLCNPNSGYEIRCAAIEQMIALMTDGRIGSNSELWNIADAFGFTYDANLTRNENADNLYAFLSVRQKWYAADDYDSIASFLSVVDNTVESLPLLQEMGVAWTFENDSLDFYFENEDIPSIVAILADTETIYGLTVPEFYDLLMQMAQYFEFAW